MKLITLAILIASMGAQTPDVSAPKPVTFTDTALGLSFDHPANWMEVKKSKKSRSKSDRFLTQFNLPTSSSAVGASLEIFEAPFSSTTDVWQSTQVQINTQLHRTVDRQWEQDILGVPLLLTRISYSESGTPTTTLTGLLYSHTNRKLLFRLTGPTSEFDNLQYAFNNSILTLRTVDGKLPSAEDPNHPLTEKKVGPQPGAKRSLIDAPKPIRYVIPVQKANLTVSTRSVTFRYPVGWEVKDLKGSGLTLFNDKLSSPIQFTFYSTLDSDTPVNALIDIAAKSLDDFKTIALRVDRDPQLNLAGCEISTVRRTGKSDKGSLFTFDVSGQTGDFYFVASYRSASALPTQEEKILSSLFDRVTLESKP